MVSELVRRFGPRLVLPKDPTVAYGGRVMRRDIHPALIDQMMDLYCDWRSESAAVQSAYDRFTGADAADRSVAFAAYVAALDREESACASYAQQIRVIESRCAGAGTRGRLHDVRRR